MANNKILVFEGSTHTVTWDGNLCIHAEECVRTDSSLFEKDRNPFAQPDLVAEGELDAQVKRCPSGALSWFRNGEPTPEPAELENTVTVVPNGPLYVRGDLEIEGIDEPGHSVHRRVALCRCGHSKNKPFCDNSHIEAGFSDTGAVGREGPGFSEAGGKLLITPRPNGSLLIRGNVSVRAASGCVRWKGEKVSLCRCGHSAKMPFCDASHKQHNFEADGA